MNEEIMQSEAIKNCQMPEKGRIVYYTHKVDTDMNDVPNVSCGIVTKVHCNGNIDFYGFFGNGSFTKQNVVYSPMKDRGHWHWPND